MSVENRIEFRHVGQGIVRLDGEEKVRGLTRYVDDVHVPDCWFGEVVRSPVACGRLRAIHFDPAFDFSRVCVVLPGDIPGENIVDMFGHDMPFIAHDEIHYHGEPLALVAAPTRELAREAVAHIRPEIEPLPAVLTLKEVIERYRDREGEGLHQLAAQTIMKGNVDDGFEEADHIITGEYWAGHQEQLYIEPQGMFAIPEKDGSVFIQGSLQCPYYIAPELVPTLKLPLEKIRVKQTAVGGAFGGKEEFPTLIAGYCALLALKCGKPVKIIYDRHQDILYTTKRHPVWTRHKTGVKNDGTITAMEVDFVLDGGAYTTLSPVVMYRGILHSTLGYGCPHVFVRGKVFRTNTFPNGAFRGFGAPQAIWGLESHMEEVAAALHMTPEEFRLKNALREGDITGTGQKIFEPMGTPMVLEKTLARCGFAEKRASASRGQATGGKFHGIGLAYFGHGSGFTGDGESRLKSKAAIDLQYDDDGHAVANIRISSTEMGQGTMTIMPQIAADGLRVDLAHVRCPFPDTKYVPDSGPTVASRTAMVVGGTVFKAAAELRKTLEQFAGESLFGGEAVELDHDTFTGQLSGKTRSFQDVAGAYLKQNGPLRITEQFKLPSTIKWNQKTFEGDSYPSYSWGCNVAEIEIDEITLELTVKKVTAIFDIGRVINPVLAKGQVEGGLTQALGYAVMEKMEINEKGLYDASRMQTYVVPTALDIPEFDIDFIEYPYTYAPPGAKGVGEMPMDGLAPAIANAVKSALGVRINELPITPEKLLQAMKTEAPPR